MRDWLQALKSHDMWKDIQEYNKLIQEDRINTFLDGLDDKFD